jgi:hypothetical protein
MGTADRNYTQSPEKNKKKILNWVVVKMVARAVEAIRG